MKKSKVDWYSASGGYRSVGIGRTGTGKTARGKRELDSWLVDHPGKVAYIIDPKGGSVVKRHFEPHQQIAEKKEEKA